jgi:hypothetical protein
MSKKPLVPNKNPKGLGKGKGNAGKAGKVANAGKTAKAAKATKAPRRTRICSRLSKGRLTILIAEVDSIAKGFNGIKGGGPERNRFVTSLFKGITKPDKNPEKEPEVIVSLDYYERIKRLFSEENMKNIMRLKEDLVNDILGTMADGLEDLVNPDDDGSSTTGKKYSIANFIGIIKNVDNLEQYCIDNIIHISKFNPILQKLPYIDKISTLVMINMLKKIYNFKFKDAPINDENMRFIYLKTTTGLIDKITDEYLGINKNNLEDLTEDVKTELEYYTQIYILKDCAYDENPSVVSKQNAELIIADLKGRVKYINESKVKFDTLVNHRDFMIIDAKECYLDSEIKDNILSYNDIILKMKNNFSSFEDFFKINNHKFLRKNPIYMQLLDNTIYTSEIMTTISSKIYRDKLYDLFDKIEYCENLIKKLQDTKQSYIQFISDFSNLKILEDENIEGMEQFNSLLGKDKIEDVLRDINNNIPFNMKNMISILNILCKNKKFNDSQKEDKNFLELKKLIQKKADVIDNSPYEDDFEEYIEPRKKDEIMQSLEEMKAERELLEKEEEDEKNRRDNEKGKKEVAKARFVDAIDKVKFKKKVIKIEEELPAAIAVEREKQAKAKARNKGVQDIIGVLKTNVAANVADAANKSSLELILQERDDINKGINTEKIGDTKITPDPPLKEYRLGVDNTSVENTPENRERFRIENEATKQRELELTKRQQKDDDNWSKKRPLTDKEIINNPIYMSYGGKLTTKYISTGNFVYILYEKKKIRRCVYAKAKGRGKYCKIKGDYILVSKLKVV